MLTPTSSTSVGFSFPGSAVSQAATVSLNASASALHPLVNDLKPDFTPNSGNTYVLGFSISLTPSSLTAFLAPVAVNGNAGAIAQGTTLNLAWWNPASGGAWTDVSTFVVGSGGAFTQGLLSTNLTGLVQTGDYVLYVPGNTTTVSNLGIALVCDDSNGLGTAQDSLQVVHLFDANGVPLATPTISYLAFAGAGDLDGAALTPDGSQGVLVDGLNTVRFFSKVQTGVPVASTTTVDISAYGGDGDSVAILPTGDEAVVSGDSGDSRAAPPVPGQLLVISGINAGTPTPAEVITVPGNRDGLVIAKDGSAMIARSGANITVLAIQSIPPKAGSLGGSLSHSYTQTADSASNAALASVGSILGEDGREGMAFSPTDPTRAVLLGTSGTTGAQQITLLTGLPGTPAAASAVPITGATFANAVSISPDGTMAVVGTDAGLALITGVNTSTLAMVGSLFAPSVTIGGAPYVFNFITTLGITLDGKYVVAGAEILGPAYTLGNGVLLTIPFSATGFSAPVGQLNDVAIPDNDQLLVH